MNRNKPSWAVRKRDGRWRVYGHGTWWDTFNTLPEAHTEATQNAAAEILYAPGGLTLLAEMRHAHDSLYRFRLWWLPGVQRHRWDAWISARRTQPEEAPAAEL